LMAKEIRNPEELLGKTDHDFHPAVMADAYIAEDRLVMESGKSVANQIWFVVDRSGHPGWFSSSKVPLRGEGGQVIGIAGVRYSIETPEDRAKLFQGLAPVVRYLEENYTGVISMSRMASLAGMSSTHFNRQFSALFGMSPVRFVHSLRVEKAKQMLTGTDAAVGEVALETGYHDQSHFTRHFRNLTGITPGKFRILFRRP
jgi:AraC-like DNA-binding protein